MTTVRLPFLYPHLFRAARFGESSAYGAKIRCRRSPNDRKPPTAVFSSTTPSRQAVFERHGKAIEPTPATPDVVNLPGPGADPSKLSSFQIWEAAGIKGSKEGDGEAQNTQSAGDAAAKGPDVTGATSQGSSTVSPQQAATEAKMQHSGPMEAVLHIPPPEMLHHPHISTPPYVHHFDSYSLVKELEAGGYSKDQAITIMKAIRGQLAQHLDIAQEGLVSKSDVDNVSALSRVGLVLLANRPT